MDRLQWAQIAASATVLLGVVPIFLV